MTSNTNNPNNDVVSLLWGCYYQLQQILAASGGGGGGVARVAGLTSATGAGATSGNQVQVFFYNSGSAAATVAGQSLAAGASINFAVNHPSDTIAAISYNATGTTLLIGTLT